MENKNSFGIRKRYVDIHFRNNEEERRDPFHKKWKHYAILHRVLNFMRDRGFEVGRDLRIEKNYKCLTKDYWYGRKGDLEFKARRYPAGFEIEFYQNINFENQGGGEYDFDKFEKMPYMIKLMFLNESNHIRQFLISLGIEEKSEKVYKYSEDEIKHDYVECWHHEQEDMNFKLSDLDGETCSGYRNNVDRDNKIIYNGQIKYFRRWGTGRLCRGKVYRNINNMWWVILNDTEFTNIASFELFDATSDDFKIRRKREDRKPKEYFEKIENIKKYSDKELMRELKKRGVNVNLGA